MTLGKRIKDLRLTLGLTQVQLAGKAGVSQGSLSAIETGETVMLKAETILGLADALGTSPEWIQTGRGPPGESVRPDPDQAEALHIFRALSPAARAKWLSNGRWLLAEDSPKPSKAHPFAKAR